MRREQLRALGLGFAFFGAAILAGLLFAAGVVTAGWICWWVLNS